MSLHLWTGPPGSGKTRAIRQCWESDPGVMVALPSLRHARAWEAESAARVHFGARRPLMLLDLAAQLERAHEGAIGRLAVSRAGTLMLLRSIAEQVWRRESGAPLGAGFLQVLLSAVVELRQGRARGETLARRADDLVGIDDLARRDLRRLGQTLIAYRAALDAVGWFDAEDRMERAINVLERTTRPELLREATHLYVDGFHGFHEQEMALLAGLAKHVPVTVTLTIAEDDPAGFFALARRTRDRLRALAPAAERVFPGEADRWGDAPALGEAVRAFLRDEQTQIAPPLRLHQAAGAAAEVEWVAREIIRLAAEEGVPLEQIAVLARASRDYAPIARRVFREAGVPLAAQTEERVLDNPLVGAWLNALRLQIDGWPRDRVLRHLRSTYSGVPLEQAERFESAARRAAVRAGAGNMIALAARHVGLEAVGTALRTLSDALRETFEASSASSPTRRLVDLASERLPMVALAMRGPTELARRDAGAWDAVCQVLSEAERLLPPEVTANATRLLDEIATALGEASFRPREAEEGVAFLDVTDARQRRFSHVFLVGVNEGVFPQTPRENPFLPEETREALAAADIRLRRQEEDAERERALFVQALATAERAACVTWSATNALGQKALRSFWLDDLERALPRLDKTTSTAAEVTAPLARLATERDLRRRGAWLLSRPAREVRVDLLREAAWVYQRLGATDGAALAAGWLAAQRPWDEITLAEEGALRQAIAGEASFTVADAEALTQCPFRHVAKNRLKLRAAPVPLDPAQLGSLTHRALADLVRGIIADLGAAMSPATYLAALGDTERFDARIARAIEHAFAPPQREHEVAIDAEEWEKQYWRRAIAQRLREWADRDIAYVQGTGAVPIAVEHVLPGAADDAEFSLRGRLDRLDRSDAGAWIIDYKRGGDSGRKVLDLRLGRSLQLPLYGWALAAAGERIAGILYDFGRKDQRIGLCAAGAAPEIVQRHRLEEFDLDVLLAEAASAVGEAARAYRAGGVRPVDGAWCRWCDFADVCRREIGGEDAADEDAS